jgi:hypothetical protein
MFEVRRANKPEQNEPKPSVRIKRGPLSQTTGQKRPRTDHDVHHTCITKDQRVRISSSAFTIHSIASCSD